MITSVINPSAPVKVGFEDILFAINNPNYIEKSRGVDEGHDVGFLLYSGERPQGVRRNIIIISTFSYDEQDFLIKGTSLANMEEKQINDIIQRGKVYEYTIIIYGKNSTDSTVEVKYKQLIQLGFVKVFVYYGGMFEWVLLREIYGEDLFPCINHMKNMKEDILLKWKPNRILKNPEEWPKAMA